MSNMRENRKKKQLAHKSIVLSKVRTSNRIDTTPDVPPSLTRYPLEMRSPHHEYDVKAAQTSYMTLLSGRNADNAGGEVESDDDDDDLIATPGENENMNEEEDGDSEVSATEFLFRVTETLGIDLNSFFIFQRLFANISQVGVYDYRVRCLLSHDHSFSLHFRSTIGSLGMMQSSVC
jgi:hypothetical protein